MAFRFLIRKKIYFKNISSLRLFKCFYGQVHFETHPHIMTKDQVTPGITREEYQMRRKNLWESLSEKSPSSYKMVIVTSASKSYMAYEVPYPFRQDTNFLYLSGFIEPDSLLMLTNLGCDASKDFKSIIFVPRKDKDKELWEGPSTGSERAADFLGCDESYDFSKFDEKVGLLLKDSGCLSLWYDHFVPNHQTIHKRYLTPLLQNSKVGSLISISKIIQRLRLVKSNAEVELMKKSCKIGSKSLEKTIRFSRPQIEESHLQAKVDFECRLNGAQGLAYPPVVAGGNRANTIHYIKNNQLVRDGEMILMDAGCDYFGYCSDITRTWPVNGRFTSEQRDLYEALLEVQLACISLVRPSYLTLNQMYLVMLSLIARQLQRLKIIDNLPSESFLKEKASQFCPHHLSHFLGMDVHDVDEMSRDEPLQPNTIITIEPGIYVPLNSTNVHQRWKGIGMRIEDDVLVTSDPSPLVLTDSCPKNLENLETLVATY